jgi:hypothetical protein
MIGSAGALEAFEKYISIEQLFVDNGVRVGVRKKAES